MRNWLLSLAVFVAGAACAAPPERVVSLGGSVTEIIYDLGQGHRLVANDASSLYPPEATRLPRVGYYRSVPLEGILSMAPDLVLASDNAGPVNILERLSGLGVPVRSVSDAPSLDSLYLRIGQIAEALQASDKGHELIDAIRSEVAQAQTIETTPRRALVLLDRTGSLMGAGQDTAANAVLGLAGLENVLEQQVGYKPISAEGLAALAPDMIILSSASAEANGGLELVRRKAGISATPAAGQGRVIAMDDLLILGIGPRVAQAIQQLKNAAR
ncbi:helical backbone metal receptor [Paenalcaligenes niemegkensis]|uniref:heme/hemin ABC transporter substrate-binding protein n=1 Tax=Paenalcaligenes niemegkensis TaxID=2895469 RepID=UPI001EE8191E|nr:helical backbone metal receptor [Paenalcaligenes niemegkensis]MCQ9616157.1 helical backbone metal receptor [Paenalcaligenes niemegkensis]